MVDRLKTIIQNYEDGIYSESDFRVELDSLIQLITEDHLSFSRKFLLSMDAELEYIDFMVSEETRHQSYLNVIEKIKLFIREN